MKYHKEHEFLIRPQPDRDWEPARRENAAKQEEEY